MNKLIRLLTSLGVIANSVYLGVVISTPEATIIDYIQAPTMISFFLIGNVFIEGKNEN